MTIHICLYTVQCTGICLYVWYMYIVIRCKSKYEYIRLCNMLKDFAALTLDFRDGWPCCVFHVCVFVWYAQIIRKVKANIYTVGVALQHWLWIWGTSDRRRRHYFPSPHRTQWPCYAAQPAPTTQPTIYYAAAKHSTVCSAHIVHKPICPLCHYPTMHYMQYAVCTMKYALCPPCAPTLQRAGLQASPPWGS